MAEVARALGVLSALLMAVSFAIWANWLRGALLQRLDGQRTSNARPARFAIRLLMVASGVSAIAAVLAVAGWVSP